MPTEEAALEIRQFDPERHDRSRFDCGHQRLNNYLKLSARKAQKGDMARIHVVLRQGEARILGYHALNAGMLDAGALETRPRGTPAHGQIPVLFLGMIARDLSVAGQGIGELLMQHVFEKADLVARQAGCYAILLDVDTDGGPERHARVKRWYADFGFVSLPSQPSRMLITMNRVRAHVALRRQFDAGQDAPPAD